MRVQNRINLDVIMKKFMTNILPISTLIACRKKLKKYHLRFSDFFNLEDRMLDFQISK